MTVRKISVLAYIKHVKSGKRNTQWMRIYRFLYLRTRSSGRPPTRAELSEVMDIRLSSVCGRINELLGAGLILESKRRACAVTGESAHTLKAVVRKSVM